MTELENNNEEVDCRRAGVASASAVLVWHAAHTVREVKRVAFFDLANMASHIIKLHPVLRN